jgi:anti-sigma B factor antagonist
MRGDQNQEPGFRCAHPGYKLFGPACQQGNASMEITARHRGDILVLDMAGRLDTSTSGSAHDAIVDFANAKPKRVVLNLDKLDYVSSAGLRVILTLAKLLQSSNGEMKICRAKGSVNEVLQTSGFNSLIKVVDDEDAAIASWR